MTRLYWGNHLLSGRKTSIFLNTSIVYHRQSNLSTVFGEFPVLVQTRKGPSYPSESTNSHSHTEYRQYLELKQDFRPQAYFKEFESSKQVTQLHKLLRNIFKAVPSAEPVSLIPHLSCTKHPGTRQYNWKVSLNLEDIWWAVRFARESQEGRHTKERRGRRRQDNKRWELCGRELPSLID